MKFCSSTDLFYLRECVCVWGGGGGCVRGGGVGIVDLVHYEILYTPMLKLERYTIYQTCAFYRAYI